MRSSGAGGQHVNRTNSAVLLKFDIQNSLVLSEDQKKIIFTKLKNRINNEGQLLVRSETSRDQKTNKENAYKNLNILVNKALHIQKKRIPTRVKKSAIETRLSEKKIKSKIKSTRSRKIDWD
jgi:ribosome-associated protein